MSDTQKPLTMTPEREAEIRSRQPYHPRLDSRTAFAAIVLPNEEGDLQAILHELDETRKRLAEAETEAHKYGVEMNHLQDRLAEATATERERCAKILCAHCAAGNKAESYGESNGEQTVETFGHCYGGDGDWENMCCRRDSEGRMSDLRKKIGELVEKWRGESKSKLAQVTKRIDTLEAAAARLNCADELRAILDEQPLTSTPRPQQRTDCVRCMPNPTEQDLSDPAFNTIWEVIKSWDVNVPAHYQGYCGANGSHVMLILDAVRKLQPPVPDEGELRDAIKRLQRDVETAEASSVAVHYYGTDKNQLAADIRLVLTTLATLRRQPADEGELREKLAQTLANDYADTHPVPITAYDYRRADALLPIIRAHYAGKAALQERIAQLTAHRVCCGIEHDPSKGKLHGFCVVCGVPWPCEVARTPQRAVDEATVKAFEAAREADSTRCIRLAATIRSIPTGALDRLLQENASQWIDRIAASIESYPDEGCDKRVGAALDRLLAEHKAWKDAVIEKLVVRHILTKENERDPQKALDDLIGWEVKVALDPAVSEQAERMLAKARLEGAIKEARKWHGNSLLQPTCKTFGCGGCERIATLEAAAKGEQQQGRLSDGL